MSKATLSKWGNSSAIRIPTDLIKRLNWSEGTEMEMIITNDNEILLRPILQQEESNQDLKAHLNNLLAQIKPESPRHEEVDWGIEGDEKL
ncbi:AbrB/MazE/SpoVT family DNA-binding domain-containing protein [Paenibacillus kyungheensis]